MSPIGRVVECDGGGCSLQGANPFLSSASEPSGPANRSIAVVEDLEQHVEHVRMCLLDFVEKDDGIRLPPDRLRQLPTLVVAT
jgi:hypothetical protein